MTTKYEAYADVADTLEKFNIIACEWGTVSFRGFDYRNPVKVTILDQAKFDGQIKVRMEKRESLEEQVKAGVYGSGSKLTENTYKLDFLLKVKDGAYPPAKVQEPVSEPVQEPETSEEVPQTVEVTEVAQEAPKTSVDGLGFLSQVVAEVVQRTAGAELTNTISAKVIEDVRKFVESEYGPIQKKVEIVTPKGEVKAVEGLIHEAFDEVIEYVKADEPVFLVGPAGCGKNVLCKQIADALGLEFYFSNAVTQEYKITGFTDAMGVFQQSQFYKAFTQGGLFFLDEMDASIPEVLLILNSAIANRYFDFPAPIGRVQAHPDFRVISAGNTVGQGASFEYVGRNQLDASSLDRFAVVQVGYDEKVELSVARNDKDLIEFIHALRKVTEAKGIPMVISYRSIGRIAKMKEVLPIEKVIRSCLFKGMTNADLDMILPELPFANQYTKATIAVRKA